MKTRNHNASYDEAKRLVEFAIDGLLPAVRCADNAIEKFNYNPCIRTGARRFEAEKLLITQLIKTRTLLWKEWSENYKGEVSAMEYSELMDEALKSLRPEGEKVNADASIFWFGNVGKELNGKEVK